MANRFSGIIIMGMLAMQIQHASANSMNVLVIGEASDLESSNPLYTETHCVSEDKLSREVIYADVEKKPIARKTLNYTGGTLTPSFMQKNFYSDEIIAVDLSQNQLTMTVKEAGESAKQQSVVTISENSMPLVIDAGFDEFVIQNWSSLVAGESKKFQFPFAARESLVELQIDAAPCSYDDTADQCFLLEIDNWLFSMLVPSIELGYDAELKRITRFRGLSNIGDGEGDGQSVDIRYRYEDRPVACATNDPELAAVVGANEILYSDDQSDTL